MIVAITGVSGFIGGQVALHFADQGHDVLGIDLRACSDTVGNACVRFLQADYGSADAHRLLLEYTPQAILHLGASSLVGPSMTDPDPWYQNNVIQTKRLLDLWSQALPHTRLIFSSSSSVYGEPQSIPCLETDTPVPLSPYGESKLMGEFMIQSYARAYDLSAVMFRYFNVCGADPSVRHGQAPAATHIIARVLESLQQGQKFRLNGNDYITPDGTCVRDHVHVQDVAYLHELACDHDFKPGIYNVGTEHGASNLEIMRMAQEITGLELDYEIGPRRAGDPSRLLASTNRLRSQGWQPKYDLHDMIQHAWAWYNR
jgi:UDP-glucose 4-epimerase